jgi:hypothetical protein
LGRAARRAAPILGALALAAAGGCGSEDRANEEPERPAGGGVVDISGTAPVGEVSAGSVAQFVSCADWKGATRDQKLATIADVRSQVSRDEPGVEAPALTDDEAMRVFDTACRPDWAGGFRLYKIYAQAAGFAPLARAVNDGAE